MLQYDEDHQRPSSAQRQQHPPNTIVSADNPAQTTKEESVAGGGGGGGDGTDDIASREPKSQHSKMSVVRVLPPRGFVSKSGISVMHKDDHNKKNEDKPSFSNLIRRTLQAAPKVKRHNQETSISNRRQHHQHHQHRSHHGHHHHGPYQGRPGADFPTYDTIPPTGFTCGGLPPGYFADPEAGCQVNN